MSVKSCFDEWLKKELYSDEEMDFVKKYRRDRFQAATAASFYAGYMERVKEEKSETKDHS